MVGSGMYNDRLERAFVVDMVRDAVSRIEKNGGAAFSLFHDRTGPFIAKDACIFVIDPNGVDIVNPGFPNLEGRNILDVKDTHGKKLIREMLRVVETSGSGIYNMQMDKPFIEDVVNRAALLVAEQGKEAFSRLRDKTGPFVFMDTYVFVEAPDGTELVNPAQPGLEGKNLIELRDLKGSAVVRDEIAAAVKDGSAWLDLYWYKPGQNTPARKKTFVRKVQSGEETYIVGSGFYTE